MASRCSMLIDRVFHGNYTPDEWRDLQKEYTAIIATASAEDIDELEESGVGEMLHMICSGL